MAEKSKDAFRTISEVADWLDVPTHVLRFWESRFAQIKPVKRAGGRRYYRPSDMRVIGGVKVLLHDQGMTIRGVQKLFREEGVKHVSSFAPPLFDAEQEEEAPLDAVALERAARPAPVARNTRDAEPVEASAEAEIPDESEAEVPTPVFRRTSTPAPGHFGDEEPRLDFLPSAESDGEDKAPVPEEAVGEEVPADAELAEVPEETPPAEPLQPILVGPDVPETDPEDDDAAHESGPGIAARLRLVPRRHLVDDRARIEAVVARLKIVLDRSA